MARMGVKRDDGEHGNKSSDSEHCLFYFKKSEFSPT